MKDIKLLEVQKEIETGEIKIGGKTFKMSPELQNAMSKSFQKYMKRLLTPLYDLYQASSGGK